LGRAPIAREALEHVVRISEGYSNLELNLEDGRRGSRDLHLDQAASRLFPAEATLVVNNNAAALLLILNSLSEGKEVIVSRGELVEIGGSFRLPEIMKKSGAILREAGTTNKTRISDYRKAINDRTGMILSVHPSNYQIIGFTEKPSLQELISLGSEFRIPVVEDHGSGILQDLEAFGIRDEPQIKDHLNTGLDLICFSGDKILGGPQAGIICGKKIFTERLRSNPLFRALRVDKMIYAALEGTLMLYRENPSLIPVLQMLSIDPQELRARAEKWADELRKLFPQAAIGVEETTCYVGGGVAPMKGIPSTAVTLSSAELSAAQISARLRESDPPVVSRIENDRVYFELRTLRPDDLQLISASLKAISLPS
jgi:L-seryl-tRNA(Ser) seleniumtransferase